MFNLIAHFCPTDSHSFLHNYMYTMDVSQYEYINQDEQAMCAMQTRIGGTTKIHLLKTRGLYWDWEG